ncbi:hypothetical protein [Leptothermofonsia sp. ETS-13]|uniref:hypothetical protein n=1 Tax=Leptothermofonsia sp. ETS-13 TaxID=3035696 RepID=UPI003BA05780
MVEEVAIAPHCSYPHQPKQQYPGQDTDSCFTTIDVYNRPTHFIGSRYHLLILPESLLN